MIQAAFQDGKLFLRMTVEGIFAPSVDETPTDLKNRYYYHWLVDTDNNPATGVSNTEYEGNLTGLSNPVGADLFIQIGWRNGAPDNVYAYDPLTQETLIVDYAWTAAGNSVEAAIPIAALNLAEGQTIGLSAFQEGASDGWSVDWIESAELTLSGVSRRFTVDGEFGDWQGADGGPIVLVVEDPSDLPDSSGDIRSISAAVKGENLILWMSVEGVPTPSEDETPEGKSNRYYYHWLLDTDNNPATGVSNSEYEGNQTGLNNPIGADIFVQVGWRNGDSDDIYAYNPLNQETLIADFEWARDGDTLRAVVPLTALGLNAGQTISVSAFQEGASDGWMVDWVESGELTITAATSDRPVASIDDPSDLLDSNGDIRNITASVENGLLQLSMTVEGTPVPSVEETPVDLKNRYYYHWLLDTDNNLATGVSNSEYEGNLTGLNSPIGADIFVQVGWSDGAPDDIYAYDPLTQEELIADFAWQRDGNTLYAQIPLDALGLNPGQTISVSAFQEGASDGWAVDWIESAELTISDSAPGVAAATVEDPVDLLDPSGDIRLIQFVVENGNLFLRMDVEGTFAQDPADTPVELKNRYYYHWLIDSDNNPATGVSNSEYEGNLTGLNRPIGADIFIQIGWRDGAPDDVYAYDPLTQEELIKDFEWAASGGTVEASIPLEALGLTLGQTISVSAFQEGASDGWAVDWIESVELTLNETSASGVILKTQIIANGYGVTLTIEDKESSTVDPSSVRIEVDGEPIAIEVTKDGAITTAFGRFPEWLASDSEHVLTYSYSLEGNLASVSAQDFPFTVNSYEIFKAENAVDSVNISETGFIANLSQVTSFQSGVLSLHNNNSDLAELQLAGELTDEFGQPLLNEAADDLVGWVIPSVNVSGVLNWYEDAPDPTGNFKETNGFDDDFIPRVPGWGGIGAEGIVDEILTYLELKAGYHTLALNTTGGFKASTGTAPADKFSAAVGEYNGSRGYSYEGDHYFDIIVEEDGFYPFRLLWFHSQFTKEGAQLEFFSVEGTEKVLINDTSNPNSIKAFQSATNARPYINRIHPIPGATNASEDSMVEIEIEAGDIGVVSGSIALSINGESVTPQVSENGGTISVSYDPQGLTLGETYEVGLSYDLDTDPPTTRSETFEFGVHTDAAVLSVDWATPVGTGSGSGFKARSAQSSSARENTTAAAEVQLAGNPDLFSGTATLPFINLSRDDFGQEGFFIDDTSMVASSLMSPDNSDNISMEFITYLELSAGPHTLGVNSDDGFRVTAGRLAEDNTIEVGVFEGGRGDSFDVQSLFDVIAPVDGVYAFRMIWYNGGGGASVELYSYDRETKTPTLVNDRAKPGSIKAYTSRTEEPTIPEPEPPAIPTISLTQNGGEILIEWVGNLQSASSVDGPWTDVSLNQSPLSISVSDTEGNHFYRSTSE